MVHTPGVLFAWRGAECPDSFAKAAELAALQLQRYEEPGAQLVQVLQGGWGRAVVWSECCWSCGRSSVRGRPGAQLVQVLQGGCSLRWWARLFAVCGAHW